MAFAAPVVAGAARATAGKAAARTTARAASKATAAKATTAAGRGSELLAGGMSRKDAARAVRDEFGSTLAEADSVLPADQAPPAAPPGAPAPTPAASATPRAPARSGSSSGGAGSTLGGFILGMAAWAVGLTFLRSGAPGVRALLRAKFLNDPSVVAAPATAGSTGRSGLSGGGSAGGGTSGGGGGSWS